MKPLSSVLLACILFIGISSCKQADALNPTIIEGIVTEFDDPYDLPAMELFEFMPFNVEWEVNSCFIESDGAFRFEFEQLYPQGILIKFKEMFSVYANPGDSIYLIIDAGMLDDTSNTIGYENNYIQIKSENQEFQDEYQDFTLAFAVKYRSMDDHSALREAQKDLDHSAYSDYINSRSSRYQAFLDDYAKTHRLSKEFRIWADNWLYLNELDDLLRYAWLHPKYNKLDEDAFSLPAGYYDFLKDERHNNAELLVSRQYRSFLHELYMHLYHEFGQSELRNQYDSLTKAGKQAEAYDLLLRHLIEHSSGFEQDYFVARFFSTLILWKSFEVYDTLYDPSLIERDDYNRILQMEYAELQELIAKPAFAKDLILHDHRTPEEDLVFQALPKKYPNKVIYVDFWAPWCGPCMAEMPHSKELQKKLTGKDVVFVFLASKCSEESWKATIAQKKLSGEHYLLDDKENALLADKFNIAGIPRYMIIDKKGRVIDNNAPRPGEENLIELLESLSVK